MAIDFPSTPSLNDEYTYNGRVWKWLGESWVHIGLVQSALSVLGRTSNTDGPAAAIIAALDGQVFQRYGNNVLFRHLAPHAPGGRLTLQSGADVMVTSQTAQTTLYYTPSKHRFLPIFDGTGFRMVDFSAELSQATTDTTKSPAACVAEACYDVFGWDDSGTIRATRGFVWNHAATITVTIASPAVVTWNSHGLREGAPVIFTTTGALPTGITAGTIYYVGRDPAANTFNIATSVANAAAGTFVNTSGSQSGTHTGTNRDTLRGTGSGTTELDFATAFGVPTNKFAITNGPAANRGIYLGTIRTNGSSQLDWTLEPAAAAGGTNNVLSVWNAYNQTIIRAVSRDSTDSWTYSTAIIRSSNNSVSNRISFVVGLPNAYLQSRMSQFVGNSVAGANAYFSPGVDTTRAFKDGGLFGFNSTQFAIALAGFYEGPLNGIGYHYVQALERGDTTTTTTWYGDAGSPSVFQSGLQLELLM